MVDKLSKNEAIKTESVYLKGNIVEELADSSTDDVSKESYELLKFHGSYQQFDRDKAHATKKASAKEHTNAAKQKAWQFMLRLKIPAGILRADQYLKLDDLATEYANGSLRITTRETFQFHGILKGNLKPQIAAINALMITTMGGCGDVVRNVMSTPAPVKDKMHARMEADALRVSEFTMPKTSSYHEIWVEGENLARTMENDDLEPLYKRTYLPRKFKIAIARPEDNFCDVLTHDLAILPLFEDQELLGYNIALGGGMGVTHNKPETYPRLASLIAFVGPDDLLKAVEAAVSIHRDYGDRSNRKHARLKYVVEENGLTWTKEKFDHYFGKKTETPREQAPYQVQDHMGWHPQGDGKWFIGIPIESGRIIDRETEKIRTGLRTVITQYNPTIRLTADQNIILADLQATDRSNIAALLKSFGIKLKDDLSNIARNFIACVSLPTCGLALAEAERVQAPLTKEFDKILTKYKLQDEKIALHMTGCPNGCARPYVGDIGIVGRTPGHYAIFVGGDFAATRLNQKLIDKIPYETIPLLFDRLFSYFCQYRKNGESFGDFTFRTGIDNTLAMLKDDLGEEYGWLQ